MARQSFKFFTPRDKPKKRGARQHKKNKNKSEKRQQKQLRYKGQGKGCQISFDILYWIYERKNNNNYSRWCQSRTMV